MLSGLDLLFTDTPSVGEEYTQENKIPLWLNLNQRDLREEEKGPCEPSSVMVVPTVGEHMEGEIR